MQTNPGMWDIAITLTVMGLAGFLAYLTSEDALDEDLAEAEDNDHE